MQKPQGRGEWGKICFPSKSNSQVRGVLISNSLIPLDVFSLLLSLTPSPSCNGIYPLALLNACLQRRKRFCQAPGWGMARQPGAGGRAGASSAAERYAIAASPPATRSRAAVASSQPAINTLAPARPNSTGHQRRDTCFRRKSGSEIRS